MPSELRGDEASGRRRLADDYEVEEFVSGEMYRCDAVVTDGTVVFATVSRYLSRPGDFRTNPYGGSVLVRDGAIRTSILAANRTVVAALGLTDGVTHLEIFRRHDELVFCEIAARPGGGWIEVAGDASRTPGIRRES